MSRVSRILLLATAALGAADRGSHAQELGRQSSPEPPYVEAVGQGEARVAPDRATLRYNVGPNYEQTTREMRQVGYVARNAITVRVTQLERIGAIIDAALARGATEVADVAFESSRADSARRVALADASAKARADAEAVARAMGGSLGALLDASTTGDWPMLARRMRVGAALSGRGGGTVTQVTPAAIEVHATVAARWRFVQAP